MKVQLTTCVACGVLLSLILVRNAAASATIRVGPPQNGGAMRIETSSPMGDMVNQIQFPVPPGTTTDQLAMFAGDSLRNIPGVDPLSVTVSDQFVNVISTPLLDPLDGVFPGGRLGVSFTNIGVESMSVFAPDVAYGTVGFFGTFQPIVPIPDPPHQTPAVFTAGIVTDVGELTATVSAAELSFQTDGPIICQALFQRLAPRAPQFGAQINYAGDRLEVYFDPAYTVTQGGVIFGTSSPNSTAQFPNFGQILTPTGDVNGDDFVDELDLKVIIQHFGEVDGVPLKLVQGDTNGDGLVDGDDVLEWQRDFAPSLQQEATGVPEPSAAILTIFALATMRVRTPKRPPAAG